MTNYKTEQFIEDNYVYRFYGEDTQYKFDMIRYAQMAKRFMNRPFRSPLDIVGNYDWHQAFPYEEHLLFDEVYKDFGRKAMLLDFGCGPGRMVQRAEIHFDHVHGVDISEYAIDYARKNRKGDFFVSSGIDLGGVPENVYDLVFSTIAIQHIPCRSIRKNIFRGIYNSLNNGGRMAVQVAYNPTMQAGVWSNDTEHASYESDFWNAKATNGHADMIINETTLPLFISDLSEIFQNVDFKLVNVDKLYGNLNGYYHAPYWASDWLFVYGTKHV